MKVALVVEWPMAGVENCFYQAMVWAFSMLAGSNTALFMDMAIPLTLKINLSGQDFGMMATINPLTILILLLISGWSVALDLMIILFRNDSCVLIL